MTELTDLVKFLRERGGIGFCPSCGRDDWVIANDKALLQSFSGSDLDPPGTGYHALVLACNNCAFLRLHSLSMLTDWLEESRKGGGSEDEGNTDDDEGAS